VVVTDRAPALFDRLADRYDQVIPFFAEFAGQLLDVLDPDPGTRLLDIGSGRGAIAAAAAARGCVVTAVDAAPRMVSLLAAAHPEIDVRLMDAHRLDLPGASFDLVTGGFVIHLVAEPLRVLAGLRRVLRPGASVALTTPGPCEDHGRWNAWNSLSCRQVTASPPSKTRPTSRALPRSVGRRCGLAGSLAAAAPGASGYATVREFVG
jgi:ubiquinone/menaquinone biosynthesis C-methylase UbiE